ncbi:MAG: hypothetical protein LV479_10540 [Methylacidiphilales bacterium]|nr:hypothetical protein [Candidatus Methylacidiphilales bacterium]
MRWPDIFFRARKRPAEPALPPAFKPAAEPPTRAIPSPEKNIAQSMDDADPIRALTRSGTVRITKRPTDVPPKQPAPAASASTPPVKSEPESAPATTGSLRRKAKMIDLARIVMPGESVPVQPPPAAKSESSSTIVPPAFPVSVPTGNVTQSENPPAIETPPAPAPVEEKPAPISGPAPVPLIETKPPTAPPPVPPNIEPPPAPSVPLEPLSTDTREKREFLLTNGERVLGNVVSETPEAFYVEHSTLGILTIPRAQIAQRLVEIILINGDRVVGDIMAETPETLYVRHASLGMLTIPRAQRSTRVVEAILKDGDRILGEVLGETDKTTLIKSATLGTISVPHDQVTMLNRKIEQIELKALPAPAQAPAIKDKP